MKNMKKNINEIFFLGAVQCLVRCTPSLLQSVITWISPHNGELVLLKQLCRGSGNKTYITFLKQMYN